MDKEDLKRLAQDPNFISGIYNYCDRWCERCPFTARCMNFAMGEEQFPNQAERDISNAAFWEKMHETFQARSTCSKRWPRRRASTSIRSA